MSEKLAGYVQGSCLLIEGEDLRELVVGLHIVCEGCGEHTVHIAGHHVRALHAVLGDVIRDYPDLTGNEPQAVPERPSRFNRREN